MGATTLKRDQATLWGLLSGANGSEVDHIKRHFATALERSLAGFSPPTALDSRSRLTLMDPSSFCVAAPTGATAREGSSIYFKKCPSFYLQA